MIDMEPQETRPAWLYLATNIVNGKVYVGQTCYGLSIRRVRHMWDARRGKGSLFHRAIRKHGEDAFDFKVLAVGPFGEWADDMEIRLISAYRSFGPQGYNATAGGGGSRGTQNFKGRKHTPETLAKMSAVKRGKVFSEEHRANLSESHKGKHHAGTFKVGYKHPEETKRRMSETRKGVPKTGQGLENIRRGCSARVGVPLSPERVAKMVATRLSQPDVECPHCGKVARKSGTFTRYHFDNCKHAGVK